ncbi:DUF4870 domain-containing protein [Streptomyces sp. NPDC020742]|uniref:DUF4870 domain-containing protein n=1 Tax=Streptomyces sp. NPDC020742 TaxID=3154897 RepID=UPI003410477A
MSDPHGGAYGAVPGGPQGPYGTPPHGPQPAYGTPPPPYGTPQPPYEAPPSYGSPSPYGSPAPYGAPQGWSGGAPPSGPSTGPAMWAHLGALLTVTVGSGMCCGLGAFLGWIFPMSVRSNDRHRHDPYVRHHATQAVNFGITQAIVAALGVVLYFGSAVIFAAVGTEAQRNSSGLAVPLVTVLVIMAAYGISGMVCAVIGTVKANRGELWTYPRLIAWPLSKG